MRCLHPAVVPIHFAILYMIQSGSYVLSPDFIATFKKIDLNEAQALWRMVFRPTETTLEDVLSVLFDGRSYGPKISKRYFVAGVHRLDLEEHANSAQVDENTGTTSTRTEATGPLGKVSTLLSIARSGSSREHTPAASQPDYLALTSQEEPYEVEYEIDREPGQPNSPEVVTDLLCPKNLEDMLFLVRELRQQRSQQLLQAQAHGSPVRTPSGPGDSHFVTPAEADKNRAKLRANNFIFTNADDFDDYE